MNTSVTLHIDDVGPVLFERSRRARRISISVRPLKGIRVAIPDGTSFSKAKKFVHSNKAWIRKQIDKVRQVEEKCKTLLNHSASIDTVRLHKKLLNQLNELAKANNFVYNKASIRNQKTRWGSCSAKNNISLNIKLIRLPGELIDYVILHELLHTRIKNHGPSFWRALDKLVGDSKAFRKKLNHYSISHL
ncbi:MAG: M48 family metallopeptidase [Deltaproteobacteria bacterium]|nr:M48 family metallopeptidase [Deltaproteobacteria bacterium]